MSIIRVNKTRDFTVMSNHHLRNTNLSLKAKGLMSQMLSLPDEWDYSIAGLAAINAEKESSIKTALDELKENGYLVVTKLMPNETASGRIEYCYDLFEVPTVWGSDADDSTEKQEGEKQGIEKQGVEILGVEILGIENQPQLNTNNINTKESNTKELNKDKANKSKIDIDAILDSVDVIRENDELKTAFMAFLDMRKSIKHPIITERALKLAINEAYKCGNGDPMQMVAVLNQSIMNSYRGIFPLKNESPNASTTRQNAPKNVMDELDDMLNEEINKGAITA